jgi:very-short-patch-repair endonuclease
MPRAEKALWSRLRNRKLGGLKFRRQYPIGPYFLDFFCDEMKLAVELDGDQHGNAKAVEHDRRRDNFLKEEGIVVLRIWNSRIRENLEGVLEQIFNEVEVQKKRLVE